MSAADRERLGLGPWDAEPGPEERARRSLTPAEYSARRRRVELCMRLDRHPCEGGKCGEDGFCAFHANSLAIANVVAQYLEDLGD